MAKFTLFPDIVFYSTIPTYIRFEEVTTRWREKQVSSFASATSRLRVVAAVIM